MHHDFLLRVVVLRLRTGRIRLTRMAAERGPILSGACGQVGVCQSPSRRCPCCDAYSDFGNFPVMVIRF